MSKHTPGPWKVYVYQVAFNLDKTPLYGVGADAKNSGSPIAGPLRNIADARLIAAAPELLEALKRLVHASRDGDDSLAAAEDQADDVIAKAEGNEK